MEMKSSKMIIQMMSERMKAYRIEYPMTQKDLAEKTGVSLRSIQNFEKGNDIQFSNLIKILKGLDLADNLLMLVPDVSQKPSMYLQPYKKKMRASKIAEESNTSFKWGDEE